MSEPKITVIINNYNYGQFLKMAIDSVLEQTYPAHEIILVDDGSTDNSHDVAREYGNKIRFIPASNSGQASTFNTGFKLSTGDWIWFLDADDILTPEALEEVAALARPGISKIHGKLIMTDIDGELLGKIAPALPLSEGNVVCELEENGLYVWPPISGNAFPRSLLHACMPIPEEKFKRCVDLYLCNHAALRGDIVATKKPVGYYRTHGSNHTSGQKLKSTRLKNQALNIIATVDLLKELFSYREEFRFPYTRWHVETLLMAKRFSDCKDLENYSYRDLYEKWKHTPQVAGEGMTEKAALKLRWVLMRYLPKSLTEKLIS
jgi:glycosyltransferase involved in cell wall biosynthesis